MADGVVQHGDPRWSEWEQRLRYEIPPWGWRWDPKCEGMNEATAEYILKKSEESDE